MSSIDWSKISEARAERPSERKPETLTASIADRLRKSKPIYKLSDDSSYPEKCRLSRFAIGARVYIWPIRGNDPDIRHRGKIGIVRERIDTALAQRTKYVQVFGNTPELKVSTSIYFLTDEEYTVYSVMES
jgi:hypothetical protein